MKIGIIGGSFDPIHLGHLAMAEYLRELKNLDKIIFIPTGNAPHKTYESLADQRLEMVKLAIEDNKYFSFCEIEVLKETTSYTAETLKTLKEKCPEAELNFIIGMDNLFSIEKWYKIEELGKLTNILVSNRIYKEGISLGETMKKCRYLQDEFSLKIDIVDSPIFEISSSDIRQRIKNNKSIKYLLPKKVEDFIKDNGLYK
ncbi:nicotinate-nucleotide adenylyltransferase [Neofamilia massiliensis]|uniref:nicotinate-nucleotide adenylyltransferase n=1 Tax=Neofamilia massiliensis TaxID=1673724 RepID=UPI0006BB6F43|nr:nicotinate-nucleotide adenylyltransferase [Neofamilia massiliensis]